MRRSQRASPPSLSPQSSVMWQHSNSCKHTPKHTHARTGHRGPHCPHRLLSHLSCGYTHTHTNAHPNTHTHAPVTEGLTALSVSSVICHVATLTLTQIHTQTHTHTHTHRSQRASLPSLSPQSSVMWLQASQPPWARLANPSPSSPASQVLLLNMHPCSSFALLSFCTPSVCIGCGGLWRAGKSPHTSRARLCSTIHVNPRSARRQNREAALVQPTLLC